MSMYNMKRGEDTEQMKVINWANWNINKWPELKWLFHIPNGGKRNKAEAARFKMAGVKAGVSDLELPVARGKYHGLFIEMKYGKNKATDAQEEFIEFVKQKGYLAVVCNGADEAINVLEQYLAMGVYCCTGGQEAAKDAAQPVLMPAT